MEEGYPVSEQTAASGALSVPSCLFQRFGFQKSASRADYYRVSGFGTSERAVTAPIH